MAFLGTAPSQQIDMITSPKSPQISLFKFLLKCCYMGTIDYIIGHWCLKANPSHPFPFRDLKVGLKVPTFPNPVFLVTIPHPEAVLAEGAALSYLINTNSDVVE